MDFVILLFLFGCIELSLHCACLVCLECVHGTREAGFQMYHDLYILRLLSFTHYYIWRTYVCNISK